MPELPEVETIRNYLRFGRGDSPPILGRTIQNAWLLWERTLAVPTIQEFLALIAGQTVEDVDRRGKYLILRLSSHFLLFHLRMSGDLFVEPQSEPLALHHRLVLNFKDGLRLAFNDARKFGRAWLVADPQQVVGGLGPE